VTLADSTGRLRLSAAEVRLSGELRLTLTVEGPAPVQVEPPTPLTAGADWRATPLGPPDTEPLPDGRQRWRQAYRLTPYRAGDEVPVALRPVRFHAGGNPQLQLLDFAAEPVIVRVRTEVLQPELKDLRPPTGVEVEPAPPAGRSLLLLATVTTATLALAAAGVGVVWWRRRRKREPPLPPAEQALADLDRLEESLTADPLPARQIDALAETVRRYLEARFGVAARRRTTHELLAALQAGDRFPALLQPPLQELLEHCDLARFAGLGLTAEQGRALIGQARSLVRQTTPPAAGAGGSGQGLPAGEFRRNASSPGAGQAER
jgi:hypothetical protein